MPTVVPAVAGFEAGRRTLFRVASQIAIHYPDSPLSEGEAGGVSGGDRLPWVEEADNFAPLRTLDWQLHVYGEPGQTLSAAAQAAGLPLHRFAWTDGCRRADLRQDAAYLIRPDGYVGLAAADDAAFALQRYAASHGLTFRSNVSARSA